MAQYYDSKPYDRQQANTTCWDFNQKAYAKRTSIDVHFDVTSNCRLHTSGTKNLTSHADNCPLPLFDRGFDSHLGNDHCKTAFLSL